MKKVAVFLMNGVEETEAIGPIDMLKRAGIKVDIYSLEDNTLIKGSHEIKIETENVYKGTSLMEYDAVFLPGGPSTSEYLNKIKFIENLKEYNKNGKLIAAICASAFVLSKLDILDGKTATVYPGFEKHFKSNSNVSSNYVEISENIISGKSVAHIFEFSFAIIEKLLTKEEVDKLKRNIVYK